MINFVTGLELINTILMNFYAENIRGIKLSL